MNIEQFRTNLFEQGEKRGFTDLELYYEKKDTFSAKVFQGEVDDYDSSSVQGVAIRGLTNGKMGYAYTEKLDDDSIRFLLENAAENAELLEAEPEEIFSGEASYEEVSFYTPGLESISTQDKIDLLKEIEKKALAYDPRVVQTDYAGIQSDTIEKALFTNKGLALRERNNFLFVGVSVLAKEGEEVKSGFQVETTKDFSTLNADDIAEKAVKKALSHIGGKVYPNKNYPVVLKNSAAASLLATYISSFSAEAVQNNQSCLKDKLGEQIATAIVTIVDDPFLPSGTESATFDAEGVPTKKHSVIENGRLTTYFHNQKTAKKDGVASTGHGYRQSIKSTIEISPSNFFVAPAVATYEQLYENMKEGIIITDLAGLHSGANQISGDFSLAADGYFVKDGKIVGATNLMTVAGNFFDVLQDVEEVGADLEFAPFSFSGYIGSPSLRIGSLAVTVD